MYKCSIIKQNKTNSQYIDYYVFLTVYNNINSKLNTVTIGSATGKSPILAKHEIGP